MAAWMAKKASITSSSTCPYHAAVIIRSEDDYTKYAGNSTLVNSEDLGSVIITWKDITDSQLAKLLEKKTTISELVIEDCVKLTTLSPAVDKLKTVSSRIVVDGVSGVTAVNFSALERVGAGVNVLSMSKLQTIEMPVVTFIGGSVVIQICGSLTSVSAVSLKTVNASVDIQGCFYLSVASFASGFGSLKTIAGSFYLRSISAKGPQAISTLIMPELETVGSLTLSECYGMRSAVFPKLKTVGSVFLYALSRFAQLDTPSLTSIKGKFSIVGLAGLSSLCSLGVDESGFTGASVIHRSSSSLLGGILSRISM